MTGVGADDALYDEGGLQITRRAVLRGGAIYAVDSITAVETGERRIGAVDAPSADAFFDRYWKVALIPAVLILAPVILWGWLVSGDIEGAFEAVLGAESGPAALLKWAVLAATIAGVGFFAATILAHARESRARERNGEIVPHVTLLVRTTAAPQGIELIASQDPREVGRARDALRKAMTGAP